MATPDLRDLVYFDFDKAASLFSQLEQGLLREVRSSVEAAKDERNVRKYDLKLFKPEFGGIASEKTSRLESRVLHHDLLARVEDALFEHGMAVDINVALAESEVTTQQIRSLLVTAPYLRAEGWSVIEDYERIKKIAADLPAIQEFIGRCSIQSMQQTPEVQSIQQELDNARKKANAEGDRNKKAKELEKLRVAEGKFQTLLREALGWEEVPRWLLDGMGLFINTFMPSRINLRVYPMEGVPQFQVLANLKRDCFIDGDLENVLFAYGTRPNVKLTVLGLITSMPERFGEVFDPMREFEEQGQEPMSAHMSFEKGLRDVFRGLEGLEQLVRFSRFPNVTVYPLAVYRTIRHIST